LTAKVYGRRPNLVTAMQVTEETAAEVADWADGYVDRDKQTGKLLVRLPQSTIPATAGDWVVRDHLPDGLGPARPMLDHTFVWAFGPVG
jgi:hypothetical protein